MAGSPAGGWKRLPSRSSVVEGAEPPRGVAVMGTGFAVARGRVLDLLDATLAPRRALVLPATGPCDGRAYATTALGAGEGLLLAGEGCSGRLIAYRVAGD